MSMKSTLLLSSVLAAASAFGQDLTPLQFKSLCETSPSNTFRITGPIKILGSGPAVTAVNSSCRIVFANPGAKIEADQANFAFAGPLVFQAGPTAEVTLVKSLFTAPSIQITEGTASKLILTESSVAATTGNISLALGADGEVTAGSPYAGQMNAISAGGAITINGGARSNVNIQSANLTAGTNLSMSFSGAETNLQFANSSLTAQAGVISIVAPGILGNFDLSFANLTAASGVTVGARGRESKVTMVNASINSGLGAVTIEAAAGAAASGAVKIAESQITSGGPVTILASRNGQLGEAVVEVSTVSAQGNLRIESGANGTTTVLNNGLSSPTLVQVLSTPGGSCVAENNTITAPVRRLCL